MEQCEHLRLGEEGWRCVSPISLNQSKLQLGRRDVEEHCLQGARGCVKNTLEAAVAQTSSTPNSTARPRRRMKNFSDCFRPHPLNDYNHSFVDMTLQKGQHIHSMGGKG